MVLSGHPDCAQLRNDSSFIIPLTIAGETVKVENAGVSYAFLMSLANVTNLLEGAIGTTLYKLLMLPGVGWLREAFHGSMLNIAGITDERTLILEIFVYISLAFTLLTLRSFRYCNANSLGAIFPLTSQVAVTRPAFNSPVGGNALAVLTWLAGPKKWRFCPLVARDGRGRVNGRYPLKRDYQA
jgi:hypothetical protein